MEAEAIMKMEENDRAVRESARKIQNLMHTAFGFGEPSKSSDEKKEEKKEAKVAEKKNESATEVKTEEAQAHKTAAPQQMVSFFPEIEKNANEQLAALKEQQKRNNQKFKVDPIPVEIQQQVQPVATFDLGAGAVQPVSASGYIPVQVPPQAQIPNEMRVADVLSKHKSLSYLKKDLEAAGHRPEFSELEGGMIAVKLLDHPEKSFTLDLAGLVFNRKHKWTPGILPGNCGYEQVSWFSYDKENKELLAWIGGEPLDDRKDLISIKNRVLNSSVNLLTIPSDVKGEDKTALFTRLQKMVQVGVFKDFQGCRFGIIEYKDPANFKLKMLKFSGYNIPALKYDPSFIIDCTGGKVQY